MSDPRAAVLEVCRRLHAEGLITATEGNVSARDGDTILITAGGLRKGELTPEGVLRCDLSGRLLEGAARPSSELPLHLEVYAARADVGAIVHAHPPYATAFAVAGVALDQPLLAEAVLLLGPVPIVPYEAPSTDALARAVSRAAKSAEALLLANHGAVAFGDDLPRALERMETLEHLARVSLLARLVGGARPLPREEVEALLSLGTAPYRKRG
ncbi:MAG TPA: class II aldolase/adducin family protein [Vicinamibacteria bacterium]|nr:class II aldolase/adducin family protein [Vicinamibacteria bacterium]